MTEHVFSDHRPPLVSKPASTTQLACDYLGGFFVGLAGIRVIGWRWVAILALYLIHPVVGRLWAGTVVSLAGIRIRLGECDLSVLVNLFRDYNVSLMQRLLPKVGIVVDAGANIGAFIYLVKAICPEATVIAFEPEPETFTFLKQQLFCEHVDCRQAAIGPMAGRAALNYGANSVTHQVELDRVGPVEVVALPAVASVKTFLKLDIEGGERAVLAQGLPENVLCVLMEWHFIDSPTAFFVGGTLTHEHTTPYGQTTWSWIKD